MKKNKIIVAGIGPGSPEDITPAVLQAVQASDVIVGYKYYFRFIKDYVRPDALCIDSGMKAERQRAEEAFRYALEGKTVCVISSGDAGIYGMSPLIYEMMREKGITDQVEVEVLPGISAFQKAAALLGCPIGHDLCIISLSDLMTPWLRIEKRIEAATGRSTACWRSSPSIAAPTRPSATSVRQVVRSRSSSSPRSQSSIPRSSTCSRS